MCGKVIGYQVGSPDGPVSNDINGKYADGISLTHGSPHKHIWSFIGGVHKTIIQTNVHVVLVVVRMLHHLFVLTIFVSLVILTAIGRIINFTVHEDVPFNLVEIYIK